MLNENLVDLCYPDGSNASSSPNPQCRYSEPTRRRPDIPEVRLHARLAVLVARSHRAPRVPRSLLCSQMPTGTRAPKIRVDFMLANRAFMERRRGVRAFVVETPQTQMLSDHFPLKANWTLKAP